MGRKPSCKCCWDCHKTFFIIGRRRSTEGRESFNSVKKLTRNKLMNRRKFIPDCCKILPKSSTISENSSPNQSKYVLGSFAAPNRAQVSPRDDKIGRSSRLWELFWPKRSPRGSISGSFENRKSVQKRTFEARRALGPSKNSVWKGF